VRLLPAAAVATVVLVEALPAMTGSPSKAANPPTTSKTPLSANEPRMIAEKGDARGE
jgi:hypothetical protein